MLVVLTAQCQPRRIGSVNNAKSQLEVEYHRNWALERINRKDESPLSESRE
jgi:hypothetical protein